MFLEIRAIPHSLALTHADTALILQYARKTRDSTSAAQSPQQVIMAGVVESNFAQYESVCACGQRYDPIPLGSVHPQLRVQSITAHHV